VTESDQIRLLQQVPIFGGMTANTLKFLLSRATREHFNEGSYLCRQGDPADVFYVLDSGHVAIIKQQETQQFLLRRLQAGDCLGEMALIDLFPRSASAIAETECHALSFTSRDMLALYERDLEQFTLIQMNLARELSRRLRHASDQLFDHQSQPGTRESPALYPSL